MPIDLPIETMSVSEKLQAVETLWASLSQNAADVESPAWHQAVLEERQQRLAAGEATLSDWNDAKQRLQDLGK